MKEHGQLALLLSVISVSVWEKISVFSLYWDLLQIQNIASLIFKSYCCCFCCCLFFGWRFLPLHCSSNLFMGWRCCQDSSDLILLFYFVLFQSVASHVCLLSPHLTCSCSFFVKYCHEAAQSMFIFPSQFQWFAWALLDVSNAFVFSAFSV